MYTFEAIYNNDNTITVKSNTFWSCKVDGNFMLSAYDGLANEEGVVIDIIVPYEIEVIEGTVTFTYGDDRCKYPEIYIYQINDCILETTPGFIENNGRKEIYFPNKNEGETISIKVKTAYNSITSWPYEKIGTNSNVFTNDSEMFIVVGSEQGEIRISNQYCDDSIYVVMCTSEGYVCEYTIYTDATIVDWYFGSTKYTSTRVFGGVAKCNRTFYEGEQTQSVIARPKKGNHVYEDVIIACGESKESYCQTTIITEGECDCSGGTITFIIDKCDDGGPTCEEKVEYTYGVGRLTLGACDTEGYANIPYTSTTTYSDCTTERSTGNKRVLVTGFTQNDGDPIVNRRYTFTSDGVQYTILYSQGSPCTQPPTPISTSITWNNATAAAGKCDTSKTVTITGTKITTYSDGSETRTSTSTTQTYTIGKNETSSPKVYTFTYNGATITINQAAGPCTTPPVENTYLTIESQTNNNRISIRFSDGVDGSGAITISASTDNGVNWNSFTSTTGGTELAILSNGQKLQLRGNVSRTAKNRIIGSGDFKVYGNVTSLTNGQTNASGFTGLFSGSTNLTSASGLLLTSATSPNYCYYHMFEGCSKLVDAPALPAMTIGERCYASMFSGCTSLATAPELPATNLANAPQCYFNMFYRCTSLTTAPELPATTLSSGCYGYMFRSCSSLTTAPSILPATALTSSCYQYMFANCTNLTTAPELPAATLTMYCYDRMFLDCSGLSNIKCLATNISASNCTTRWVANIASSGTFTKAPNMCDWSIGVDGIPEGWNVSPDDCGGDEPEYCEPIMDGDTGTPSIALRWFGMDTNGTMQNGSLNGYSKRIYASAALSLVAHLDTSNSGGLGSSVGGTICRITTVDRYCAIIMRTKDYGTWPGGTTNNEFPTNSGTVYTLNDSTKKVSFNMVSTSDENNGLLLRDLMVNKVFRIPYSGYRGKTQFCCYPYRFSSSMFALEQSVSYLTVDEENSVMSGKNAVNGSLTENGFTMHYENVNDSSLEYELTYEISPNTTCKYKDHLVKLGRTVTEGTNYYGTNSEGGNEVAVIHFLQEYKTKNRVYYGQGFTQETYDDNYNETHSEEYKYHMFFETCSSWILTENEKVFSSGAYLAYPLTNDFEYDVSMDMGTMEIKADNYMWGDTPMRIVTCGSYYRVKFTKKQ